MLLLWFERVSSIIIINIILSYYHIILIIILFEHTSASLRFVRVSLRATLSLKPYMCVCPCACVSLSLSLSLCVYLSSYGRAPSLAVTVLPTHLISILILDFCHSRSRCTNGDTPCRPCVRDRDNDGDTYGGHYQGDYDCFFRFRGPLVGVSSSTPLVGVSPPLASRPPDSVHAHVHTSWCGYGAIRRLAP